jgi:hypothetical protein
MRNRVTQVVVFVFGPTLCGVILCVAVMTLGFRACHVAAGAVAAQSPTVVNVAYEIARLRADMKGGS